MEIADYLRIARRHLLVLVGVPMLATALAVLYIVANPRPTVATTYVGAPPLMGSQYGTYQAPVGSPQFPNDFAATATSPAVQQAVARQTQISVADLQKGLSVQQVDVSSQVQLTYTTRDPSKASRVAVAVARQTLTHMFEPPVRVAQAGVWAASASMHAADEALASFTSRYGRHPQHLPYVALKADLDAKRAAAATTLTVSQQVLAQAKAQLVAAGPDRLQPPQAEEVSLVKLVVTTVIPAAAVGLFLAIVLVALLELVSEQRREVRRARRVVVPAPLNNASAAHRAHQPVTPAEMHSAE